MAQNQMLDHVAKLPRSGHDLSQSFAFTASTGMLLPVYSDFVNVSETVYIKDYLFARSQPLVTAAMADVDFYLDWFFVPMTMLYTGFGQIRWQTKDFVSSFYEDGHLPTDSSMFPLFNLTGSYFAFKQNMWVSGTPFYYNSQGSPVLPTSSFDCVAKSHFRLLDCLGFNPLGITAGSAASEPSSGVLYNPSVFLWKALAYQCVYQRWYRNDDYEPLSVSAYNVDRYADSSGSYQVDVTNGNHPFTLRFADYRRDYFTNVKPSAISSSLNVLSSGTTSSNLYSDLDHVNNFLAYAYNSNIGVTPITGQLESSNTTITPSIAGGLNLYSTASSSTSGISITNTSTLRSLFAVEKLLRITGRAAKDYDSQTLAHFGFKVPHDVKHDITRLRSSHGILHIGEVVGTADTFDGSTGSALGEIAGKGYVSIQNGKSLKFTAPVDGAIMCIFRAIPRQRIVGSFDKQNAVARRTDLYIPEFDKLGMQPIYNYEFDSSALGTSNRFGWQLRYEQYKKKYDRASYVFGTLNSTNTVNQYSAWALSRLGIVSSAGYDFLKCPPTALNSIMQVPYTTTINATDFSNNPAQEFYTDPFICDFRANVKKVSPMSPTGEPDMMSF